MIKQWFHGLIVVVMLSLLVATFAPAPLSAANRSLGATIEQDTNQGDDQNDDDQNQAQSQNQGNQNQQGQQQGTTQAGCFAGTDQGSANFPTGCWTSLSAGGRHWYQFRYQGLSANRDDDDDDDDSSSSSNSQPPTVDVRLKMETPGCISFWVMTPERLQNPDPDGDGIEEPVGAGTPIFSIDSSDDDTSSDDNSNDDSDDNDEDSDDNGRQNNPADDDSNNNRDQSVLNWQGAANANITFYVIVRNNRDFSCSYSLSIQGAGVPVPGQQAQPSQAQQSTQGNTNGSANNGSDDNGNGSNGNGDNGNNDDNGDNNDNDGSAAQG